MRITHIFLGYLQEHLDEIDKAKPVATFCGSGRRTVNSQPLRRSFFHDGDHRAGLACLGKDGAVVMSTKQNIFRFLQWEAEPDGTQTSLF